VGPSHDDLMAQATKLGVSDRVHLIGEVAPHRIFEFIACGDLFVFPTLYETFGLSAAEAAIAGVPVVANDLPVLREVLSTTDKKPAALFVKTPQNNGKALAHQIKSLLQNDGLRAELSTAGRQLAQKYAPETMCDAYEKLLPSLNK
jgi:glycosyltransferase involved in cell wall biosynthesis